MYEQFFGFSKKPFNIIPDPEFLFMTESHQEALASLVYGIQERRGFISISGEVGTGKTTLLNYLRKILDQKVKSIFIFQTHISFEDLLREILHDLDLPEGEGSSKFSMTRQLRQYLLKAFEREENLAILIDEAQNLSEEVLEELRMLSNLETGEGKLFQMVLVGQPELERKLNSAGLRQLKQRIGIRRKIRALSEEESTHYINRRLKQLGSSSEEIFTPEALGLICRYGEGIFRSINIICDNAFLIGYGLKRKKIDASIVKEVLEDMGVSVSKESFQSKRVYSPEAAIDSHYCEPSRAHKLDSEKEYQARSWWTAPRISGIVAIGLIVFLAWLFLFSGGQLPTSNSFGNWLMKKTRSTDFMPGEKNGSPKKGSAHQVKATKAPPNSKVAIRKKLEEGSQQSLVSDAAATTRDQDRKKTGIESSKEIKGQASSDKMIEVPEGENLYSLIDQYYGKPNPTIVDYVLENNPTIENMHQLQIRQRIVFPKIDEESLLMRSHDGIWKVHLGTFPTSDIAGMYKREPSLKGKEIVTVERRVSPQDIWYRLIAAGFDSREEGLKVIQELKRKKMLPALSPLSPSGRGRG